MDDVRAARVAAILLGVGVLSLVVTTVMQWMLQPSAPDPTPADVAAQFPAAWTVLGLLAVFGPLAWLGAIPAVMRLPRRRGRVVTVAGGVLTALALGTGIGHLALFFGLFGSLAAAGASHETAQQVAAGSDGDLLTGVLLVVFLVAFALGPIVLTIGLRIAGLVPVWVPVAAVVTAAASFLGGPIAGVVQLLALLATWVPTGVALARRPAAAADRALGATGRDRTDAAPA
ncbi:hypothetical protein [Microbacterium luticocti]|uniref:hypothetical protein n=1 Tax=Microbacterium luticocti TaxID=451764 RepID=UPI0003F71195|nr:hypothetical protein [Microbacterium luticocti]